MAQPTTVQPNLSAAAFSPFDALFALLAAVLAVLIAIFVIGPAALQLQYPIAYTGDALSHGLLIKTIVDTGWYFDLSRVGAPFTSSFLSYPMAEGFHIVVLKILAAITNSYAASFNLFYLSSFALIAAVSYAVMRFLGLSKALAVAGAVIYSVIPFHFLRLAHLFLASYVAIPIAVGLAYLAWRRGMGDMAAAGGWRRGVLLVGAAIIGSAGVYYAAFACALLGASAVSAAFNRKSVSTLAPATGLIAVIGLVVALNLAPHFVPSSDAGRATNAISVRQVADSELYALRPTLLLLPTPGHRWAPLAAIGDRYSQVMLLVNENRTAALGTLGSIGLLLLLLATWRRMATDDARANSVESWLATQSMFAIAVGTFGGLGALFAVLVSPALRGYNRISVVISFLATAMLLLVLQRWLLPKISARFATAGMSVLAAVLIVFAGWDQTSASARVNGAQIDSMWQSDAAFVRQVEKAVDAEDSILVWPYVQFPEQPAAHEEGIYGLLRLPLHARQTRWSYGAMAGSEGDRWLAALAGTPVALVPTLAGRSGMAGVVVARKALKDGGREADSIFAAMLGPPKVSGDGQFAFYRIEKTGKRVLAIDEFAKVAAESISRDQFDAMLKEGVSMGTDGKTQTYAVSELLGFSVQEAWGRWTDAAVADHGTIRLSKPLPASGRLILKLRCFAGPNCDAKARIRVGTREHSFDLKGVPEQDIVLPLGGDPASTIELFPAAPTRPRVILRNTDDRIIGLGVVRFRWEPAEPAVPARAIPTKVATQKTGA